MTADVAREGSPESGPGSRKRRRVFLWASGVTLAVVLLTFRAVLLPFALAIVLAYVLSPAITAGERIAIAGRRAPRWIVVLVTYLVLLGSLSALVALAVPRITSEINTLSREAPRAVAVVRGEWLPRMEKWLRDATAPYLETPQVEEPEPKEQAQESPGPNAIRIVRRGDSGFDVILPEGGLVAAPEGDNAYRIGTPGPKQRRGRRKAAPISEALTNAVENTQQTAVTLLHTAQTVIQALTRGIFTFFLTLMISAYLLITSARVFDFLRSFYVPARQTEFDYLVHRIDRGLAGVVRGQLLICAVNGVLSGLGFYFLGVKYWVFLTLIAAVMSIIPIFGAILSSIPAVLIALSDGPMLALLVLGWIILIHQIEANLLNPKIMGDAAKVHPVLVVFALLAGANVAGVAGALFAVPVLSIAQSLFLYLRERALNVPKSSSFPPPPPAGTA